jgi:pimeloyl-ACP methyl ester carboxylesterase
MSEIRPRFRRIDGLSIRYALSDEPRDTEALLFGVWTENMFLYDATWSKLARHARLTVVELPGFGHSELRADLLTPSAMGEFMVRIADSFGLAKPHVVAPDIGTPAILFAAADHPDRFASLVVGDGAVEVPLKVGGPLAGWVTAEDLSPYRAMGPKDMVTTILDAIEDYELPELVREDYLAGFQGQRFVDQMPYVRSYPSELPILRDRLADVTTPVQIIWGSRDPAAPLSNAEYLQSRLPNSRTHVIDATHQVWEQGADEFGDVITAWWQANATTGARS